MRHGSLSTFVLLTSVLILGVVVFSSLNVDKREQTIDNRPIAVTDADYVSSQSCRSCHPSQYETWHGSFHRTMTQVASPDTVRADFDGITVDDVVGSPMRLERRGEEFWAEFEDPGWEGPVNEHPRVTRQVVMITGSHHQNIYWYATEHNRALNVLPAVFLLEEERWVPRSAVVLTPPNQGVATLDGHWNAICISCHTTNGKTKFDSPYRSEPIQSQTVETTVAEFGIACESCHGPGRAHVTANQNPWRRYGLHLSRNPDSTIVNPTTLDATRSSQVCGQCHSIWEFYNLEDERAANSNGLPYRPGDTLSDSRFVAQPRTNGNTHHMRTLVKTDPEFVRGSFWPDGLVRVSGREYNGLVDSSCFINADSEERTLSCFSCHTMHKAADDSRSVDTWATTHQVSTGMDGNNACSQCHNSVASDLTSHTHHNANSPGSRCYNCHMPYTSYGLMRAVRSHTITSPSIQETLNTGRPNACNLCHLDRTLAWAGQSLNNWYNQQEPHLNNTERTVAASVLWLLKGDAGQRAITAWSYGWKSAQTASGTTWMVPYLAELLTDPYDTVRYIAAKALRTVPGYEGINYDFIGDQNERIEVAVEALTTWRNSTQSRARRDSDLLLNLDGTLDITTMRYLFNQRDNSPLFLRE